ncbi:MAG: sel1 repeat family protein [Akkermansia sp.]|nr:sel1 repeat family protein [Akkermansia sp.]
MKKTKLSNIGKYVRVSAVVCVWMSCGHVWGAENEAGAEPTPAQLYEEYTHYWETADDEQSTELAIDFLCRAAEAGYAEAQFQLACYCTNGVIEEEDLSVAVKWYRAAAEQGHAKAQWALGMCYMEGVRVEKNVGEGLRWFHKAAELGYIDAYFALAWCYENGEGVAKDPEMCKQWYAKALDAYRKDAENGCVEVQDKLAYLYEPVDFAESLKWYRKAAEAGYASSQYSLGLIYARGEKVEKDVVEAEKWFRAAAKQEHRAACRALEELLKEKKNAQ